MKTKKIILFGTFAVAAVFSACKKDDPVKTTLQKLQAKWNFQVEYYHENYGGTSTYDTTYASPTGEYVDFRTDGKAYFKYNGANYDTTAYSLIGDSKIVLSSLPGSLFPFSDTADIQVLTDNKLQVYNKEFDPAPDYYESTLVYTK